MERAEERAEEGAEERAENSILEMQFRFQMPSIGASWKRNSVLKSREAMEGAQERADKRAEEGAEERAEESILETEFRFQMPFRGASWKRNSVSKTREAEETAEDSILEAEFRFQDDVHRGM